MTAPAPSGPRFPIGCVVAQGGAPLGRVRAVHTTTVTATVDGSERTLFASPLQPAYVVERPDGSLALRSEHLLERDHSASR